MENSIEKNIVISEVEEEQLAEALKSVVDPELGINIVDLGLIYGASKTSETDLILDVTLTSPACPLTDMIEDQIYSALIITGMYTSVEINWVWSPPWSMELITEDGKEQMRSLGFSI